MTKSEIFERSLGVLVLNSRSLSKDQLEQVKNILSLCAGSEDGKNYTFDDGSVCAAIKHSKGHYISDISYFF